ncbi:MAG: serine hydrolase domain-containing protein [Promethearchaeota archaeon]
MYVIKVSSFNFQEKTDASEITYWPTTDWLSSTPEAQGMDSYKLNQIKFHIQNQSIAIHSVLVVRNGYIVLEEYFSQYSQDTLHPLYSVTKSFISTLISITIQKGFINSLDQKLVDFFSEKSIANLDTRKKSITLENLLTMSSGLKWDEWTYPYYDSRNDNYKMVKSGDCVQYVLDQLMVNDPGVKFNYNSGVSHVLSAIIQQTTECSTLNFAQKYLFTPLGISNVHWTRDQQGVYFGGGGLSLTSRDMAKLGYLYLNNGTWGNKSLISKEWVNKSTTGHISTQFNSNYGYQWWVLNSRGIYFASGIKGQNVIVFPKENVIVVFTADLQGVGFDLEYQLLQDYVLPAVVNNSTYFTTIIVPTEEEITSAAATPTGTTSSTKSGNILGFEFLLTIMGLIQLFSIRKSNMKSK